MIKTEQTVKEQEAILTKLVEERSDIETKIKMLQRNNYATDYIDELARLLLSFAGNDEEVIIIVPEEE